MQVRDKSAFWTSPLFLLSTGPIAGVVVYLWATHGECAPHAIDGQCGMSTFFGSLFACCVFLVIEAGMAFYLCLQRRRINR